jgi:hypothetical protein
MKKGTMIWALPLGAFLLLSSGCSNTVRYLTTMKWLSPPPGAAAAQGAVADDGRTLYVTYWEGSCSSGILGFGRGCTLGDSKIRRCNVKTDNQLECFDELEATQAFARQK